VSAAIGRVEGYFRGVHSYNRRKRYAGVYTSDRVGLISSPNGMFRDNRIRLPRARAEQRSPQTRGSSYVRSTNQNLSPRTVRSPVFSEFVLELETQRVAFMSNNRPQTRGDWTSIDKWLARCRGVRLIVRMYGNDMFRKKARDVFPLMAKSGRISFESCSSVN